jgi:hypothetical protein
MFGTALLMRYWLTSMQWPSVIVGFQARCRGWHCASDTATTAAHHRMTTIPIYQIDRIINLVGNTRRYMHKIEALTRKITVA